NKLVNRVFEESIAYYHRKSEAIAKQAYPVLREILNTRGNNIENIIIPFTDGTRGIQISAPLQKSVETNGREVIKSFEKNIVLALIDDTWKEHLREMDDLKQSVQNAVYEQKDPLIIYKMEAFNLFKSMLASVNKEVVSFLFKGGIPVQEAPVQEARPQPSVDLSKLKSSRTEVGSEQAGMEDTRELQKTQPIVRQEEKIGRNDPCPCGSGKKYKNCHGANA